jgi:hypothetical protein
MRVLFPGRGIRITRKMHLTAPFLSPNYPKMFARSPTGDQKVAFEVERVKAMDLSARQFFTEGAPCLAD